MRFLIAFLLLASTAAAQSDLEIAIAIANARARVQHVSIPSEYDIAAIAGGAAELARTETPPAFSETSLPAGQQPTPMAGVGAVLAALNPQPHEVLVDYGCGFDARYLITACRLYGTQRAIGVEIDPAVAESARRYVEQAGMSDRIKIVTGDATKLNIKADIGVAYLWPETLARLRPQIEKLLDRFASYAHAVPGMSMTEWAAHYGGNVYVWRKPPRMMTIPAQYRTETYQVKLCGPGGCRYVTRTRQVLVSPARTVEVGGAQPAAPYVPQPAAYSPPPVSYQRPMAQWNGRMYSAAKAGCNCSMCRSIRRQLAGWN